MKTAAFWKWFSENNYKYLQPDSVEQDDELFLELLAQLHRYCNHLFFEIGGHADGQRTLIISAEGDLRYFEEVERLVADAPDLPGWEVVAFKPPLTGDLVTKYEDVTVASNETWFMPLQNVSIVGLVVRLYFTRFDPEKEEQYQHAGYLLLHSLLGEKLCAEMIRYVEVAAFDGNAGGEDLHPLEDLPEFIEWYLSQ